MQAVVERHRYAGRAIPAKLNIIARYTERMLSSTSPIRRP